MSPTANWSKWRFATATLRCGSARSNWNAGRRQLSQMASDLTLAELNAREELAKTVHDGLRRLLVSAALNLDRHVRRETQGGAGPVNRSCGRKVTSTRRSLPHVR